jgi:4-carboxymuconolactone decarboxylase
MIIIDQDHRPKKGIDLMAGDPNSPSSGSARRERAQGPKAPALQAALAGLDPGVANWADEFVFGSVWARPGLEHRERMLVAITALGALGHTDQLKNYLHGALADGMAAQEIHEALVMLVVYSGFPTALRALTCWMGVVESVRRRGDTVDVGF